MKKDIYLRFNFKNKILIVMETYSFENLDVWKESRNLVLKVYHLQKAFPSMERFGLCDQLRRAVISVSSNIVEGNYRTSPREQIRFIEVAFGSLMEVYCQLLLAYDLKYISVEQLFECKDSIEKIRRMLIGLRKRKQSFVK